MFGILGAAAAVSVAEPETSGSGLVSDVKRKSVSWGDSQDMSVCRQLTIR